MLVHTGGLQHSKLGFHSGHTNIYIKNLFIMYTQYKLFICKTVQFEKQFPLDSTVQQQYIVMYTVFW